jgi:hypothetical protein
MSTTKRRGAVTPALQAAPSLLASVDSQIVLRQRVSPATMAWDILSPDSAAIDIGEVDDRRTINTNPAPATICNGLHPCATESTERLPVDGKPSADATAMLDTCIGLRSLTYPGWTFFNASSLLCGKPHHSVKTPGRCKVSHLVATMLAGAATPLGKVL